MNEDQTPLFEDAESSNSDILRVARERAEVAYLKAKRDGMRDPVVFLWVHDDDATSHDPEIARVKEESEGRGGCRRAPTFVNPSCGA